MNSNNLKGYECPKCGYKDAFWITVHCQARVIDDGIEDTHSFDWDAGDFCTCDACHFMGKVSDFRKDSNEDQSD